MTDEQTSRGQKLEADIDRAAILARRRRFILMALGGLGCQPHDPPPTRPDAAPIRVEGGSEPVATEPEESREAMVERAERAQAEGDLESAIAAYEEIYYRAPDEHLLAFQIGELAVAAGDCNKASAYLRHFVEYGDPERDAVQLERARQLLDTPALQSCEPPPPARFHVAPEVCLDMPPLERPRR